MADRPIGKIGSPYLFLEETTSTHFYALQWLAETDPAHGSVVSADFQSAGVGQNDRSWFSDPGKNLLLSIILRLDGLAASDLFRMNMAFALCVRETIVPCCPLPEAISIKWPNDVLVGNRKIAGILVKNSLSENKVQHTLFSLGLNVNQPSFPEHLSGACSLAMVSGREWPRQQLESSLFSHLEECLELLYHAPETLEKAYFDLLYGKDQALTFQKIDSGQFFTGTITGISSHGELMVACNALGGIQRFRQGEILFVKDAVFT